MTSGHPSFDHTIQEANRWLRAIAAQLHFQAQRHAYGALRAVLHALRDRLQIQSAVNFGVQLPMVVRGLCYEGWRCAEKPSDDRTVDEFLRDGRQGIAASVSDGRKDSFPRLVSSCLRSARPRRIGKDDRSASCAAP